MATRLEWIVDRERFAAVRGAWNDLVETRARPFSDHEWFWHWWNAFGAGRQLEVCALWRDEKLAAVFPLCRRNGSLEALANVHTPVFEPIARSAGDLRTIIEAAVRRGSAELRVHGLPADEGAIHELQRACTSASRWSLVSSTHTSPMVRATGPLEEYLKRPGLRGPLPRYRRKMAREHDARFEIVAEPEVLEPLLTEGLELEAAGWKGRAGTAIACDRVTERFYRGVADSYHRRGELRVSQIRLDGVLVAFDLCVLRKGRLWLLKTAYEESSRRLAPGLVMRLSVIERCFELGLEAHELAGDTSDWKRRFANDERAHVLLTSYERRPRAAAHVAWRGHARPLLARTRRSLFAMRGAPTEPLG